MAGDPGGVVTSTLATTLTQTKKGAIMSDKAAATPASEESARRIGRLMFAARWIMAPIYIGLLVALVLVVVKFVQKLVQSVPNLLETPSSEVVFGALTLVDLSLVANLIIIVVFAGWDNFVGRLFAAKSADQPEWLSTLDFSALKMRLVASVAAIATIMILETFIHVTEQTMMQAALQLAILLGIGVLGVLLALMDRLNERDRDGGTDKDK
jgi:uncharacterized protein (TIGR00645 family)